MNTNNIDKSLLKNALLDHENVTSIIKENVKGATKELVTESIKEMMSKLIMESDDEENQNNDEDEVKDTFSDDDEQVGNDTDNSDEECDSTDEEELDGDESAPEDDAETEETAETAEDEDDGAEGEWDEFNKYKIGDRKYDFTSADEDDLQGVYSILKNDDNIEVRKDGEDVYKVDNGETEFIVIPTENTPDNVKYSDDEIAGDEDLENALADTSDNDDETEFDIDMDDEDDADMENMDDMDDDAEEPEFDIELDNTDETPEDDDNNYASDDEESDDEDLDNNIEENRRMSNTIYEISLNEDDNLGYGMKQGTVMTTPTDSANFKNTEEWDDGVNHGENKPNLDAKATPFEKSVAEGRNRRGRRIYEAEEEPYFDNTEYYDKGIGSSDDVPNCDELATPFENRVREGRNKRGHRMNEDAYDFHSDSTEIWDQIDGQPDQKEVTPFEDGIGGPLKEGRYKCNRARRQNLINKNGAQYGVQSDDENFGKHTSDAEVPVGKKAVTEESIIRRTNNIIKENNALKQSLNKFARKINEASVVNVNLKNIVRLVTENTTSASEKKSIREQFAKCKTVKESNMLYNTIKNTLTKSGAKGLNESVNKKKTVIAEQKQTETPSTTEKVIYKSNDLKESLDLMSRMNKIMI